MKTGRRYTSLLLFIFGVLCLASGCTKSTDCCTIIDTQVNIHYTDSVGNNLIPTLELNKAGVKIYYKNGNTYDYVYNGNLDAPGMFDIYKNEEGDHIMIVYPSNIYEGNTSTTLIELNETVTDTLIAEFDLASNREICKTAWLNGVEMDNRYIEVKR